MKVATPGFRTCNRCGKTKSLAELVPHPRYHQGHQPLCRGCDADRRVTGKRRTRLIAAKKTCFQCFMEKPSADFALDINNADGLNNRCKPCRSATRVKDDPRVNRDRFLRWRYGITIEDYDRMYAEQGGVCKVCGAGQRQERREALDVDHCHRTGKVRGLLCSECNRALGLLEDDAERIAALLRYVEDNQ